MTPPATLGPLTLLPQHSSTGNSGHGRPLDTAHLLPGGYILAATGTVLWSPSIATGLDLGVLTVTPNAHATLTHDEHGSVTVTEGTYLVRRGIEPAERPVPRRRKRSAA